MQKIFSLVVITLVLFVGWAFPADTLERVVIVTRHGVRAPTWTPEQLNQYSSQPWPDFGVPPGYLTPRGFALMKIMGTYYREYLTNAGLLSKSLCGDAPLVYIWADTDQRTIETGKALSDGLLPGCTPDVHSLQPGSSDPIFNAGESGHAKPDGEMAVASIRGRIGSDLNIFTETYRPEFLKFSQILDPDNTARKSVLGEPIRLTANDEGASLSGSLSTASTLTQVLLLEYANGMSGKDFGWGRLTLNDLVQIHVLHTAYADLMRRSPYVAKIRGSNLLNRVVQTLKQETTRRQVKMAVGPKQAKVTVLVGHDSNISNLSGLLDLSWVVPTYQPNDSPPGGALVFSLWKGENNKEFVRVQFVTQTLEQMHNSVPLSVANPPAIADLYVPACSTAAPGYPCDWSKFVDVASQIIEPAFVEK